MARRFILAAAFAVAAGTLGGAQPASAHCTVNVRTCAGHCYINAGSCYGSCYINAGYCGSGASCTVNVGACTDPAILIDVCSLLPGCHR